jgi:cytochrome c oxidase subunit 2
MAAKADDPNKVWTVDELKQRGESLCRQLCCLPSGDRQRCSGRIPCIRGLADVNGAKAGQVGILLNGKNAMPSWKSTLSDTEIAAVITYTRNSWSNKAAENIVQPAEVLAARK